MPNVTKFPLQPDQESQLRSTNEKIAKLAAVSPYCDIHSAFTCVAQLAMEALGVAMHIFRACAPFAFSLACPLPPLHPRNTTTGPLPVPRPRRTLNADEGMVQMRSSRQRKIAQGGDWVSWVSWFSWLLPTLLCLILIVCLTSFELRTISHARAFRALQDAPTASTSDPIRISYENGSVCFPSGSNRVTWSSFLQSDEEASTSDAVLALVQISPRFCRQ